MRPYIVVTKIPNFDPTRLPYWEIYEREGTAKTIKVGGTMAGQFTAGLSGGQRKLLLFELICQRTANQSELLIVLDEPFAGVTDDFVPFIVDRLNEMRKKHNILLVTNDHVDTLTKMADNTITVSAIDRSVVRINSREKVNREKAIQALAIGDGYVYKASGADLKFFFDVEVASNGALVGIAIFSIFCYALFLATFWNSDESSQALVLVASGIISYFCLNPYLLSLVEWRNAMNEEAEALVHASKSMNKALKMILTLSIAFVIASLQFGIVNATINGLESVRFWVAILFDNLSLTFPLVCLGLYTHLPFQAAQILGSLPFLLMIFLSTTFSPGAGVQGIRDLRYLFSRYYFWCMVPSVEDSMEGCPSHNLDLVYLILSGLLGVFVFLSVKLILSCRKTAKTVERERAKRASMHDDEFVSLQVELYGQKVLRRLQHENSTKSIKSLELNTTNGAASSEGDGDAEVHA